MSRTGGMTYPWEFISRFRREAVRRLAEFTRKHNATVCATAQEKIRLARERIKRAENEIKKQEAKLREACGHPRPAIVLEEGGFEDDYGSYQSGEWSILKCSLCDTKLDEWESAL